MVILPYKKYVVIFCDNTPFNTLKFSAAQEMTS